MSERWPDVTAARDRIQNEANLNHDDAFAADILLVVGAYDSLTEENERRRGMVDAFAAELNICQASLASEQARAEKTELALVHEVGFREQAEQRAARVRGAVVLAIDLMIEAESHDDYTRAVQALEYALSPIDPPLAKPGLKREDFDHAIEGLSNRAPGEAIGVHPSSPLLKPPPIDPPLRARGERVSK